MNTSSPRLHGLDTLRAAAIVLVVIFHLASFLPAALRPVADIGWMGVDLFFVLSGFLIGSQLLKPYAQGRALSLTDFYLRRAYRILPAYFAVLLLYRFVPLWREHPGLEPAWKFLTFTQNLIMNYPADLAFSHAWSLCVEEHFYLILPCLILWQMFRPSAWKATILILSVVLGGILLRRWELLHILHASGITDDQLWPTFMKRIYYPTYTRLDGLVAGVTLACIRTLRPAWWAKISHRGTLLLASGLLISAIAVWTFHAEYPTPERAIGVLYGFPLLALGLGLLVASAASSTGPLRLRLPGAQTLATLAFSLYLTHKEIAHLDRTLFPWLEQHPGWPTAAVYAITCLASASLLYVFIEQPFLRLRDRHLETATARRAEIHAQFDPAL